MTRLSCSQPSVFASAPGNKVLYKQASKYSPNEQTPLLLHRACQQGFILPGLEFTRKTDGGMPHSVPRTMARVHMMMSMVIGSCTEVTAPQGLKPQVTVTSANESSVLAGLTNHSPGCHHNQSYAPRGQTSQLLIAITTQIFVSSCRSPQIDYPGPGAKLIMVPCARVYSDSQSNLVPARSERDVIKLCRCPYKP